jgi:hypothetical protein
MQRRIEAPSVYPVHVFSSAADTAFMKANVGSKENATGKEIFDKNPAIVSAGHPMVCPAIAPNWGYFYL